MTNSTFARATARDIGDLQRIVSETGLFPAELVQQMLAPFLSGDDGSLWLICHSQGLAVGFTYSEREEMTAGTWNMRALGVRPDYQRQGFGAALVRETEAALRRADQRLLIVDTSADDTFAAARAFYQRIGYEEEARIRDFWDSGDDKITFRKAL